jgi:hypothetical protein
MPPPITATRFGGAADVRDGAHKHTTTTSTPVECVVIVSSCYFVLLLVNNLVRMLFAEVISAQVAMRW